MTLIAALHRSAFLLLLALSLSACAVGRSVVEIKSPPSSTSGPTDAKAFAKIVAVEDHRVFQAAPDDASVPSLQDAKEISDPKITARAVARKRGGYGMALGDILLPEGQSVAGLVRDAARSALQDQGYAVVEEGAPQYASAAPLGIDISEFWAWFAPGFFNINLEFRAVVKLDGQSLVGADAATATSHLKDQPMAAFESTWIDLIQRGTADLRDRIKERIKPAAQN